MLTKEEIIILRTIFLEFGYEKHRQSRLQIPYENLAEKEDHKPKHTKCNANLGPLIDNLESFGQPEIDDAVFNFFLSGSSINELIIVDAKRRMEDVADWAGEDATDTLNSLIFLKSQSESQFFVDLRMGLYYKGIVDYKKSEKYLFAARQKYMDMLLKIVKQATENLEEFFDENYDFETHSFKEAFIPGKDYPVKVVIPLELLCSLEETPSFHLGELYLDQGEELSRADKTVEAQIMFEQSVKYFLESDKVFESIFYGKDSNNSPLIPSILRELEVITGFPEREFHRNYYLERNLTSLRGSFYPIPKTDAEWKQATEDLLVIEKQPVRKTSDPKTEFGNLKKQTLKECREKYVFWGALHEKSQNLIVEGLSMEPFKTPMASIIYLSNALENELTDKLLEKIPSPIRRNLAINGRLLGIGPFLKFIRSPFAKPTFKKASPNFSELYNSLKTVRDIRGEQGAHPIKDPSLADYEKIKGILLKGKEKRNPFFQDILSLRGGE